MQESTKNYSYYYNYCNISCSIIHIVLITLPQIHTSSVFYYYYYTLHCHLPLLLSSFTFNYILLSSHVRKGNDQAETSENGVKVTFALILSNITVINIYVVLSNLFFGLNEKRCPQEGEASKKGNQTWPVEMPEGIRKIFAEWNVLSHRI